ncbi:hypothetical protein INR49_025609 [Caranx melampygus]|nr:hypothetical protein INR49_025609 [Caranx melampygus]
METDGEVEEDSGILRLIEMPEPSSQQHRSKPGTVLQGGGGGVSPCLGGETHSGHQMLGLVGRSTLHEPKQQRRAETSRG